MPANNDDIWLRFFLNLSKYIDSQIYCNRTHSFQVAHLSKLTALSLNASEDEVRSYYWASLFHDIGKIGVPEKVLIKKGPLSGDEWLIMKLHPLVGANMVRPIKFLVNIIPTIIAHQEKFDGSGYPFGLRGKEIPLGARILAVIDAYDAMTNDRVYRRACTQNEAIDELKENKGKHFDPKIVDAFIDMLDTSYSYRNCNINIKNKSSAQSGTKDITVVPPCLLNKTLPS